MAITIYPPAKTKRPSDFKICATCAHWTGNTEPEPDAEHVQFYEGEFAVCANGSKDRHPTSAMAYCDKWRQRFEPIWKRETPVAAETPAPENNQSKTACPYWSGTRTTGVIHGYVAYSPEPPASCAGKYPSETCKKCPHSPENADTQEKETVSP